VAYEPKGLYWEDFTAGRTFETLRRTVDGGDVSRFAGLSGDFNPLHTDAEFAARGPFGERIAHGMLTLTLANGYINLLGIVDGTAIAFLGMDRVRFTAPVRLGDTIHAELTVKEQRPTSRPDRGIVTWDVVVVNQRAEAVLTYEASVMLRRRP
jgi:acyl dehydratase